MLQRKQKQMAEVSHARGVGSNMRIRDPKPRGIWHLSVPYISTSLDLVFNIHRLHLLIFFFFFRLK